MISSVLYFEKDRNVLFHTSNVDEICKTFKPGFYRFSTDNEGNISCKTAEIGELHEPYKSKDNDEVLKNTIKFFSSKKLRKQMNAMGFPHKMGVMLHGKPGTGKTTLMNYIASLLVDKHKAVVMICESVNSLYTSIAMCQSIREIQDSPIVLVLDEFETFVKNGEEEAALKNFLDGTSSVDNTLTMGATNYIESVPQSIISRPSRIRMCREIKGVVDIGEMESIANNMLQNAGAPEHLPKVLAQMENGLTLDEIKNIVVDTLTGMKIKTDPRPQVIGFGKKEDADELELEADDDDEGFLLFKSFNDAMGKNNKYKNLSKKDTNL